MKKLSKWIHKHRLVFHAIAITIVLLLGYIFGSSVLENVHLSYIRSQSKNVVTIVNSTGGGGTGFIVKGRSGKRYILTNTHICRSANGKPLMAIYRGDRYLVQPIKEYESNDLCVVESPKAISSNMSLARSTVLGERAYSIGHPLLEPITVSEGELSSYVEINITTGENVLPQDCSGETYTLQDLSDNQIATFFGITNVCYRSLVANSSTIPILPGNSGSPTVNIYGNVIGVVFAANDSGVHSYHVPLYDIKLFLDTL